jgi:glycosyltransferase involved in cell wall biosynthesis
MTKPKLLYVVTEDWYFVSHRLHLIEAAREAGFDVAVATRVNDDGARIRDAGFRVHPIPFKRSTMSPFVAASEMLKLRSLYAAERPDIVHHVALKPVVLGSLAARGLPIRGIVNAVAGLGTAFASRGLASMALRVPLRGALRAALNRPNTRVIVQNADDLEELTTSGLADPAHIRLIKGSGVDLAAFDVGMPPPGPPLVVLPARLIGLKGVFEFVAATRILRAHGIVARFALVGAPDRHNATSVSEAQLDAWRDEGAVEVWGYRRDMPGVLKEATIVCLPTYYREGMPKALLEAAAAHRAIVTTDVAGAREIVRNGTAGWLVPPRDAVALAAALGDAIANSGKREAFAEAAYADAVAFYDARRIAQQTIDVYLELLRG